MPVADPGSGRFFIWIVLGFMFLSLIIGGAFLALYLVLPTTPSLDWLPVVGFSLVCLPWGFWIFTLFYRFISRAFGFRIIIGGGGGGGGGGNENDDDNDNGKVESPSKSAGEDGKPNQNVASFGENGDSNGIKRTSSAVNSLPIASKESEMPLTPK
ncbi:hypothetical protein LINPERPRIM_LOCUS19478 [Linum perenne]